MLSPRSKRRKTQQTVDLLTSLSALPNTLAPKSLPVVYLQSRGNSSLSSEDTTPISASSSTVVAAVEVTKPSLPGKDTTPTAASSSTVVAAVEVTKSSLSGKDTTPAAASSSVVLREAHIIHKLAESNRDSNTISVVVDDDKYLSNKDKAEDNDGDGSKSESEHSFDNDEYKESVISDSVYSSTDRDVVASSSNRLGSVSKDPTSARSFSQRFTDRDEVASSSSVVLKEAHIRHEFAERSRGLNTISHVVEGEGYPSSSDGDETTSESERRSDEAVENDRDGTDGDEHISESERKASNEDLLGRERSGLEDQEVNLRWELLEAHWPQKVTPPKSELPRKHVALYKRYLQGGFSISGWLLSRAFDHPRLLLLGLSIQGSLKVSAEKKVLHTVLIDVCSELFSNLLSECDGYLLKNVECRGRNICFIESDFNSKPITRFLFTIYRFKEFRKKKLLIESANAQHVGVENASLRGISQWSIMRSIYRYSGCGIDLLKSNSRRYIRETILGRVFHVALPLKKADRLIDQKTWLEFFAHIHAISKALDDGLNTLKAKCNTIDQKFTRSEISSIMDLKAVFNFEAVAIDNLRKGSTGADAEKLNCIIFRLLLPRFSFGERNWVEFLQSFTVCGFTHGSTLFDDDEFKDSVSSSPYFEAGLFTGYAVAVLASWSTTHWFSFSAQARMVMHVNDYFGDIKSCLEVDHKLAEMVHLGELPLSKAVANYLCTTSSVRYEEEEVTEDSDIPIGHYISFNPFPSKRK